MGVRFLFLWRLEKLARSLSKPNPVRRTQEDRSSATQLLLRQAAISLLTEVGYERMTTAQISARAGVSKGALAHHFASKEDLLVAAFQHLLSQWEDRQERYANKLSDQASLEDILLNMWRMVFGRPDFLASLELMLAARHNPVLRQRLRDILKTWTIARDETFRRLIPLDDPEELAVFLQVNFCILRGLAVYEGLNDDKNLPQRVLTLWGEMARAFMVSRSQKEKRKSSSPAQKTTQR